MRDDISRIGPGKRDFVTFCSGNGGVGRGGLQKIHLYKRDI